MQVSAHPALSFFNVMTTRENGMIYRKFNQGTLSFGGSICGVKFSW